MGFHHSTLSNHKNSFTETGGAFFNKRGELQEATVDKEDEEEEQLVDDEAEDVKSPGSKPGLTKPNKTQFTPYTTYQPSLTSNGQLIGIHHGNKLHWLSSQLDEFNPTYERAKKTHYKRGKSHVANNI